MWLLTFSVTCKCIALTLTLTIMSIVTYWEESRTWLVKHHTHTIHSLFYSVICFHLHLWSPRSALNWQGGGPRVVVSTAAFHARVRGSVPGLGGLKETKVFLPHPRVKVSIVGSLRDREVAYSASDRQGSNFESCVWRTVSSQSSHHPQEVLLAQFSLYVHKGGLKPDSFHFISKLATYHPCIRSSLHNNFTSLAIISPI